MFRKRYRPTAAHWLAANTYRPRNLTLPSLDSLRNPVTGKPSVIAVVGGTGIYAPYVSGALGEMMKRLDILHYSLSSGGTMPGLLAAAGFSDEEMHAACRDEFDQRMITKASGLSWFERQGLDAGGVLQSDGIAQIMHDLLDTKGADNWEFYRYKPEDRKPDGVSYRVGVSVCVWEPNEPEERLFSPEELRNPKIIHALWRKHMLSRHTGVRNFHMVDIPNELETVLPQFKDDKDLNTPSTVSAISCSQWPAFVPWVKQDPRTGKIMFFMDGANIDKMQSRLNDGKFHGYPLIGVRVEPPNMTRGDKRRMEKNRELPFGHVFRLSRTGIESLRTRDALDANKLTDALRSRWYQLGGDAMRVQLASCQENLPRWIIQRIEELATRYGQDCILHGLPIQEFSDVRIAKSVPGFNGFLNLSQHQGERIVDGSVAPIDNARVIGRDQQEPAAFSRGAGLHF